MKNPSDSPTASETVLLLDLKFAFGCGGSTCSLVSRLS